MFYQSLIVTFLLLTACLEAQTVGELLKSAGRLESEGHLYDAALLQEKAWRIKPQDKGLAWQAGQNYYFAKDYRKAADCLSAVKMQVKEYPLSGLYYARALKQDGRYREAMEAYTLFLKQYQGEDKKILEEIVVTEMRGCDYALQLKAKTNTQEGMKFEILPESVNSVENEFAPIPITDDLLYFSSNFQGAAKIYRVNRQSGIWSRPEVASGLPAAVEEHFGNGCFSPDGSRFYFTQCTAGAKKEKISRAVCGIYLTRRLGSGAWSEPERLRAYINAENSTNTQPTIFELDGEEVMIFSSDRDGGRGGMDLYRCSRPLTSNDMDFSLPTNLGERINTIGDELTPFVNAETGTLYFSSNGHLSLGGYDLYQVDVFQTGAEILNLGAPYNSSADEYGYTLKKSGNGGFLVSNRLQLPQKSSTRHDDLFEFSRIEREYRLTATVFDDEHRVSLKHLDVSLFEKDKDGRLRLLTKQAFAEGDINFVIEPDKQYAIEVSKNGYQSLSVETTATTGTGGNHKLSVNLLKNGQQKPVIGEVKPSKPQMPSGTPQQFFIQLESVTKADLASNRYEKVRDMGVLTTLNGEGKSVRVALGPYPTRDAANAIAREVRAIPDFGSAYVVRF